MSLLLSPLVGAFVCVEHRNRGTGALGYFILIAHGGGDAGHRRSNRDEALQDLFALVHGGVTEGAQMPRE